MGGLLGGGPRRKQRLEPAEAVEIAILASRFKKPIGVKRELVAFAHLEPALLKRCLGQNAQRKRARKDKLLVVHVGRGMAGAGHGAGAVAIEAQRHRCGKASLQAPEEPAIEAGQNLRGPRRRLDQRAHRAHNHRNRHGGLQTLAAHIAQHNQRRTFFKRNDLEKVSANLLRRAVGAGQVKAGECGQIFRYQHLLQFARILELALHGVLAAAAIDGVANDRVHDGEKQQRAQNRRQAEVIANYREQRRFNLVAQRPVGVANALHGDILNCVHR